MFETVFHLSNGNVTFKTENILKLCVGLLDVKPGFKSKQNTKSISSAISSQKISGKNSQSK